MMRVKAITHTLKACFSNQPKVIVKPTLLEFDFKIPNKSATQTIQTSPSQLKITKAKRAVDVSKILKKKKEGESYKAKVEQSYQEKQQQIQKYNLKTAKYHEQEYFKGENLLENIPLDPYYSYKLADFQRKMQLQKDKFKAFVSGLVDFDQKAQNKFQIAELYHEKQQKYEVEEFLRYMDEYPGSPKGPLPEDDLDFYIQYAYKKIPAVLASELASKNDKEQKKKTNINLTEVQSFKIEGEANMSSVLGQVRTLEPPVQKDFRRDQQLQNESKIPIFNEYSEIPDIPELEFKNYQHYMRDLINWHNFKNYYVKKNGTQIMTKELEYIYKVECENDPEPDNEYFVPRGNAPSLLRYYKTLPKQLQDHPGLKDIYLGLEFHCPDIPYEEKQQALNLACTMILPLDKVSTRAMSDFIEKKKEYLTPFMVDKIFTINPEYTWDIKDFFAEIKREQLKGQSMIRQNEGSYPQPPQVHLDWENGTANLPVDFYENEDGFWDEIISEKLKRQDEAKPIMKNRKHFYH